ncbi:hypothetical protein LEP1GSC193_3107 [Leptospira alstonii serovar Pingchang str. 80-412]|uniref:Uncharacterized protein n=2 Tax=Leptospira alstonii TaxID=28452 RepID=M6CTD6_9LEPT|nr:hypothetical protein LEP1GSC194_2722 [Leptospira alstonii serovar Sichuan str. 79601]EQA78914.1 hypothetical protein LEP1GSC193_3107 [Leptospira alstonii serovar Pingchang str. 80-412]
MRNWKTPSISRIDSYRQDVPDFSPTPSLFLFMKEIDSAFGFVPGKEKKL